MLDNDPPNLLVDWMAWDSGFRGAGLRVGDQVDAVDGEAVTRPATVEEGQKTSSTMVGQYGEYQRWAEAGRKDGDPLQLTVRRKKRPQGWEDTVVTGRLLAERTWFNDDQRRILGPGGPESDGYDGFSEGWAYWYDEKLTRHISQILVDDLSTVLNSRYELEVHLTDKPRVDHLVEHYRGLFADAVKADWDLARDQLEGSEYELLPGDLQYRRASEDRMEEVRAEAGAAWAHMIEERRSETIATFPAVDPLSGDIASAVGKCVVLPPVENRDWIPEAGHNYFAKGDDGQGWYFVDAESEPAFRMLRAAERYRGLVWPNLPAAYTIIGRVLADPRLLVMQDRGRFGLQLEPVAALAGEHMFVDLTSVVDGESPFVGEAAFSRPMSALPADDASPAEVLETLVNALKHGDQALWKALYATWWTVVRDDGRVVFYPNYPQLREDDWEPAQRLVLSDVYDIRVIWTGDVREIATGMDFEGAPRIDEVDAQLEHVGLFDGTYRTFIDRLSDILNNMLDGVSEPTAEALKFRAMATVEDARFFATLAPLRLGDAHDALQLRSQNMEFETLVLRVKWPTISQADKALLDAEREAAVDLGKFIQDSIERAVPARDSVGKAPPSSAWSTRCAGTRRRSSSRPPRPQAPTTIV